MVTSPRASARSYPVPNAQLYGDWQGQLKRGEFLQFAIALIEWIADIAGATRGLQQGKSNNIGTVTLTASQATTTLSDPRIGIDTAIVLVPTTANAAAEVGAGGLYQTYPNTTEGQATLNHANNAQNDRTFAYALVG